MSATDAEKPRYVIRDVSVSEAYARVVMENALSWGISSWCEVVALKRDNAGRLTSVTVRETGDDDITDAKPIKVTLPEMKEAIRLVIKGLDGAGGEIRKQVLDGAPDGPRCDAVFQVAALGEVKYA